MFWWLSLRLTWRSREIVDSAKPVSTANLATVMALASIGARAWHGPRPDQLGSARPRIPRSVWPGRRCSHVPRVPGVFLAFADAWMTARAASFFSSDRITRNGNLSTKARYFGLALIRFWSELEVCVVWAWLGQRPSIRGLSDCQLSTLRYFLCAKIIFVVGQDTANENHTTLKEDFQDESVFIPTNIDHDVLADEVSSRIIGLEVGELFPIGLLGALVPAIQGHSGVRIIFPGLPEPSATDNTQVNNLRGSE